MGSTSLLRNVKDTVKNLDRRVGKRIFRHNSGFRGEASSRLFRLLARSRGEEIDIGEHLEPEVDHLRSQQFSSLECVYPTSLIQGIRKRFDGILESKEDVFEIRHGDEVYSRRIASPGQGPKSFEFSNRFPEVESLVNEKVRKLVQGYYNSPFTVESLMVYRNYPVPEAVIKDTEVLSDRWHCDGRSPDVLKLFVALHDVEKEHGPLHFIPRDPTRDILSDGFVRSKSGVKDGVVRQKADPRLLTGPAGVGVLVNTNLLLHRAGVPDEGKTRDLVQIQFTPSSEPLPEGWLSEANLNLEKAAGRWEAVL